MFEYQHSLLLETSRGQSFNLNLNIVLFYNTSGLYYKHITILNDESIMTLQVVASPMIVILTTLEMSFMLLANIYSRGITHDDAHVTIGIYL
jgi:hypothetical protein